MLTRLRRRERRKGDDHGAPAPSGKEKPIVDGSGSHRPRRKKIVNRFVENPLIEKLPYEEYRDKVRHVYDGAQGKLLMAFSVLSLHVQLGERIFRRKKFDLAGATSILDVGSGAGQLAGHVLKYADPGASVTCSDLSYGMLTRAARRLKSDRPQFVVADISRLPFRDGSFDCVTCGYVLEHLPDARMGLAELARVMTPGGRMLLITTEDNFGGALTSRIWRCRTNNRKELRSMCEQLGLEWRKELWFSPMHRLFRAGGICVEIVKETARSQ